MERVKMALGLLKKKKLENIIVVTHGVFLKHIFEISGKRLTKKEDGAFVLCELINEKLIFLKVRGIEYQ